MKQTETIPFPGAFLLPSQNIMARKYARHHSEKQQRAKRSVEDADMSLDEYMASGLADKLPVVTKDYFPEYHCGWNHVWRGHSNSSGGHGLDGVHVCLQDRPNWRKN